MKIVPDEEVPAIAVVDFGNVLATPKSVQARRSSAGTSSSGKSFGTSAVDSAKGHISFDKDTTVLAEIRHEEGETEEKHSSHYELEESDNIVDLSPASRTSKEIVYLDETESASRIDFDPDNTLIVNTAMSAIKTQNEGSYSDSDISERSDDDDGEGFLKPVRALSPHTPVRFVSTAVKVIENESSRIGSFRTSSLILERSNRTGTVLQLGGGHTGSLILAPRSPSENTGFAFGVDKFGNHIEIPRDSLTGDLNGSLIFQGHRGSVSYGSGSQHYSGPGQNKAARSLSFADERGQDLAKVTEVHDTHYRLRNHFFIRYIGARGATLISVITFCLCIIIPLVIFILRGS